MFLPTSSKTKLQKLYEDETIYTIRVLDVFDIYHRKQVYVKNFKTRIVHFVSFLRIFTL